MGAMLARGPEDPRTGVHAPIPPPSPPGVQATYVTGNHDIVIESAKPERDPVIKLTDIHLSRASDPYQKENDYAGFILYSHDGKTDWYLNRRHCKTGYLVIQNTSKKEVQRYRGTGDGMIHGAVYKNVFGENIGNTVGEAFAYMNGAFRWRSNAFNTRYPSSYHDHDREMAEITKKCVSKVLEEWRACEGYLPTCRNYEVKDLLSRYAKTKL